MSNDNSDKERFEQQANWVSLTAFERDVLAALHKIDLDDSRTPYGLAIKRTLKERGYTEVNHGRLYPVLNTLATKGLVEKRPHPDDNRTNLYTLTDDGHELITSHARDLAEQLSVDS